MLARSALVVLFAVTSALNAQSQSIASVQTVPSVIGLSVDSARAILLRGKLQLSITDSTISKARPGTVLTQNPERGSPVPQGRVVYVTVSRSQRRQNPLGNLIGSIIGIITEQRPQQPAATEPPATVPPPVKPQTPPANVDTVDTTKTEIVATPESVVVPPTTNIAVPHHPADTIDSAITHPVTQGIVNPIGSDTIMIPPSAPTRTIPWLVWLALAVVVIAALALLVRSSTKRSRPNTVRVPVIRPQITRDPGSHSIDTREPLIKRSGVRLVARRPAGYSSTVSFTNSDDR